MQSLTWAFGPPMEMKVPHASFRAAAAATGIYFSCSSPQKQSVMSLCDTPKHEIGGLITLSDR